MLETKLLEQNLKARGFAFSFFEGRDAALTYLQEQIQDTTVGIGGSMTVKELGLYEILAERNSVAWHMRPDGKIEDANSAAVYISSLNGLAETGELINIDGTGNRLAATSHGKKRVYFIVGRNKLAADFDKALWRARNIAAPKNAARFSVKTPCVTGEPRCYDCQSPERICAAVLVHWQKPRSITHMEIVLIDEDLGY